MTSQNDPIVWLNALGMDDLPRVGPKAAYLGDLVRLGLPVPAGFVVLADVFEQFLDTAQLRDLIERRVHNLNVDDAERLAAAAGRIKRLIVNADLSPSITEAIRSAYRRLDSPLVAVRSSPLAGNGAEPAATGQFATLLNVRGERTLILAIKHCWASAFGPEALFYRAHQPGGQHSASLAVVVQQMVQAEVSGVAFTGEPLINDPSRLVVEAIWGLGQAVAEGLTTPDLYVLDRKSLVLIESQSAPQEQRMELDPDAEDPLQANRHKPISVADQSRPKLGLEEVRELARLALQVQDQLGSPQEIEWARQRGAGDKPPHYFLLQARPMSAIGSAGAAVHPQERELLGKVLLSGPAGSPGVRSGRVRIISKPQDMLAMAEGDVLVATSTDATYVPAMRKAAAVIIDGGDPGSHAAVTSRELGIPCVAGTGEGTQVLKDRQRVTVDGTGGRVLEGVVMPRWMGHVTRERGRPH